MVALIYKATALPDELKRQLPADLLAKLPKEAQRATAPTPRVTTKRSAAAAAAEDDAEEEAGEDVEYDAFKGAGEAGEAEDAEEAGDVEEAEEAEEADEDEGFAPRRVKRRGRAAKRSRRR
jgi:hypothetical protein